jgi:small subunit ribosomal protein S20
MPIKHAAAKHLRQTKKRTAQNKQIKKTVSSLIKAVRKAVLSKEKDKAAAAYKKAATALDKATQKRVITKNRAAHLKSRLARQLRLVA